MTGPSHEYTTLDNIGGGGAVEKFDRELQRVLENIADPNTNWKAKRSIILKVTFEPDEERSVIDVTIESSSKIAPPKAQAVKAFLQRQGGGKFAAVNINPRQMRLPSAAETVDAVTKPAAERKD